MMELLWLLLPVAAASGWWVARREYLDRRGATVRSADYFKGLNYLIDDKPDQAIEVFTRMADVDRAVGVRRAVVQHELLVTLVLL